jgi:uncharacterized protein
MIRTVVYLLVAVLLITFLRSVIGMITRAISEFASPPKSPQAGELKKDPVCGLYVPEATSVKKTVGGKTVHFCSPSCRDKYHG